MTMSTRQLPLQTNCTITSYDYLKLTAYYTVSRAQLTVRTTFGTVTRVVSEQTMEVDGMPRYVRDLRSAVPPETAPTTAQTFMSDDEELPLLPARRGSEEESSDSEEEVDRPTPRRSGREKRFPEGSLRTLMIMMS